MSEIDYTQILQEMEESERESFMAHAFEHVHSIKGSEVSLYEFTKRAWHTLEGDKPFREGWHIGAICEHLEACTSRQIKRLLINIPPRFMKSMLVSVMWPAWVWLHKANEQFLYASYAQSLSTRDSVHTRRLISSPWYQERWADRFKLVGDQNTKMRFENDRGGYRIAASVGSALTGEGGSVRVTDDPNHTKQISDVILDDTLLWYTSTWSTRKNDPENDVLLNIQQRTHEKDITGYILERDVYENWVKLVLPMEFEEKRRCKTIVLPSTKGIIWEDPRKKENELLWPNFWNEHAVEEGKSELGNEYAVAGQFQQRPAPAEGGFIKKEWFKWWKDTIPPRIEYVVQSWDTAFSGSDTSDYSACVTMGVFYNQFKVPNVILLNAWRGHVEYPDLRKLAQEFHRDYRSKGVGTVQPDGCHKPTMVLIESKGSGQSLVQDFRRAGIPAIGFDPARHGDKQNRVKKVSHLIESGQVWAVAQPPNFTFLRPSSQLLVDCCAMFPAGKSRDIVDAMTQILIRLNLSGWINNPGDEGIGDTSVRIKQRLY